MAGKFGRDWLCGNQQVLGLVALIVRFIYRRADLLLVQSRAFVTFVASLVPSKPIMFYPNSVDQSFCAPSAVALPDIRALDQVFPVVFAGNIGVGQGVEIIVEAASLLKDYTDIRFVLIGQGSSWNCMREQVELMGLTNLHLPGHYPVSTMPGLMQKAGALLASLTYETIFAATVPNKLQAYMASGRPILVA